MAAALKLTCSGALPDTGSAAAATVGAWLPAGLPTVIAIVSVAVLPARSVAVTVAVNTPLRVYTCRARRPATSPGPSPNDHRYVSASPSGSVPVAENCTSSGAVPDCGTAAASTVGDSLPTGSPTVIAIVAVSVLPAGSLTVSFAT